jgi:osmotically-inducible protein OsmY
MAEAKGKENVAMAELEAHSNPSEKARHDVNIAKAEAAYAVAKEKCDVKTGNDKTACVKEAQAKEARAKANAGKPAPEKSAAASPKKESAGVYFDDSVITAKVKAAVLDEPSLKSAEINVETYKGIVQLSGFVRSRADINRAAELANGVKGVKSVKNDMILKGTQ